MLSDYMDAKGVSGMSFERFKKILGGHPQIAKHKFTLEEAFKELGGKTKKVKYKSGGE